MAGGSESFGSELAEYIRREQIRLFWVDWVRLQAALAPKLLSAPKEQTNVQVDPS